MAVVQYPAFSVPTEVLILVIASVIFVIIYITLSKSVNLRRARYLATIENTNDEVSMQQQSNLRDLPLRELRRMAQDRTLARAFLDKETRAPAEERISFSDTMALVALLVTVISPVVVPLLQQPLLFYSFSQPQAMEAANIESFVITIHNFGLDNANNVFGSLNSDSIRFVRFTSEPYLATHFEVGKQVGNAYFRTDALPPQSRIAVTVDINSTGGNPDQSLVTYVRSDQSIGYSVPQIALVLLSYAVFSVALSSLFVHLLKKF